MTKDTEEEKKRYPALMDSMISYADPHYRIRAPIPPVLMAQRCSHLQRTDLS